MRKRAIVARGLHRPTLEYWKKKPDAALRGAALWASRGAAGRSVTGSENRPRLRFRIVATRQTVSKIMVGHDRD